MTIPICEVIKDFVPEAEFNPMINIAHNYAAWEHHFDEVMANQSDLTSIVTPLEPLAVIKGV